MTNVVLLLVCLLGGMALRRWRVLPASAPVTLNQLLVSVFMPVLTLLYIPELNLTPQFWLPVLAPWLVFLSGLVFFGLLSRFGAVPGLHLDRQTVGTLQLTGGISSISFVGFPLFELLYGKAGLAIGIMMSQAGTFLVATTLGVLVASWHGTQQPSGRGLLTALLRFPPFPVFVVALLANQAGYHHPVLVRELLEKLSSPFSVLALLTVGLQLDVIVRPEQRYRLALGLFYKLVLAPLLIFGLFRGWLGRHDYVTDLCVLGAAIGPMNMTVVLANRYGLNTALASQMVGIGIPLSLPFLVLIYHFLLVT